MVCKIFEKVVKNKLCNHLLENDLLSEHQFGFVPGRSCVTQLLVTIQEWMKNLDEGLVTDVAYMDFRKAFDAVPHKRLIYKLQKYGIDGNLLLWIKDFLSQRTQYVKVNDSKSDVLPVISGVPQGSVLGPMLFVYYINDLPNSCAVNCKIFADDTKAFTQIRNDNDILLLQNSIDSMFTWTQTWQLNFNAAKCKILHIGEKNPHHTYYIGQGNERGPLETTNLEKDLGVLVDSNLNFEEHIQAAINKSSQKKRSNTEQLFLSFHESAGTSF